MKRVELLDPCHIVKKLAALLLVLVGLVFAYVWASQPTADPVEPVAGDAPAVTAEIARVRLEARERGEIDVSPCSAGGRVLDLASGRGVSGALVQLRPHGFGRPITPDDPGTPLTASTDDDGAWTISRLAPGRYVLTASAPDHLPGQRGDLALLSGQANTGLDLALERGGHPLRGTVSDVSGGPIEGVVIAIEGEGDGNMIDFSRTTYPALSDDEGQFVVQVRDGVYTVSAWHPDYTGDSETADVDGGPRTVSLRLTPAGTIEGVVRVSQGGAPVEGAIVSDGEMGGFGAEAAQTDVNGRFRLGHLRPGPHKLTAVAAGHATNEPVKVELGIGEALTGVEIRVDRAYKITGFVVPKDDPRRSLDGVMVAAYSLSPMQVQLATAPSGIDGYFEIFGVKPGTYSLGSVAEEALPEVLGGPSVTVEAADVIGVVIQLDRGVQLRGRVEPATLASISLSLADDEPGLLTMLGSLGNMFVRGRADLRGEFSLRPVKPGKLRVIAEAPDGARGQLDVEVGERGLDDVVVVLEPRASASGRIVDVRGTPLRSGSVEYQPRKRKDSAGMVFSLSSRARDTAPIGEDGSYTLRGLDGGEYDVRVLDRAGNVVRWAETGEQKFSPARKTLDAAIANTGLDFSVELRDGVLRGVVVDPDGAPIADAWVTAAPVQGADAESRFHRPEADNPAERVGVVPELPKGDELTDNDREFGFGLGRGEPALTGDDGRFEFTGLARRTYTLQVEALKGSARGRLRGVAVGSEVRVQVAPLAELAGTVRFGGAPVTRYELRVAHKHGGTSTNNETVQRADGAFQLDHLESGTYQLTVTADAGHGEAELELKAGEHAQIALDLQPWARLRGMLIDGRTGAPIAGMSLTAHQDDSFQPGAMFDMMLGRGPRTDASGRFEVPRIAAGKGTLQIFDGDMLGQRIVAELKFEVEAGAEKDLGTIRGVTPAKVPKAERGMLGLRLLVATDARRPRPPGTEVAPLEAPEADATPRHLYVLAVTIDGPADEAGLQPGDELLMIDGSLVSGVGADTAEHLLSPTNIRRGQSLTLELERDGGRQTVTVEAAAPLESGE